MSKYYHPTICDPFTETVRKCHEQYGKHGEDCVREELEQKKCLAQFYCPQEAHSFYNEPILVPTTRTTTKTSTKDLFFLTNNNTNMNESKVSCATIVEVFAKPENELLIPEGSITAKDRRYCREMTHSLAKCLSKSRMQI